MGSWPRSRRWRPTPQPARRRSGFGYLPVTGHAKFFVAKEHGFFEREGLDVELVEFVNSADGINALNAGKLDVGSFGTTAPLVHISKGTDLRFIGGVMGGDVAIVTTAAGAGAIKAVPDLRGKKVATVRLATGDAVLRGALHDAGLDWRKDVQLFELKNPPARDRGGEERAGGRGRHLGPARPPGGGAGAGGGRPGRGAPARSPLLPAGRPGGAARQRATWVKLVRAILRAEKFVRDDHPRTVAAIAKYLKLDPPLIEKALYSGHLDQSSDPNTRGVEKFWKVMQASEFVDSKEKIASHVEVTIYKEALDGLVKESPKDAYWAELEKKFAARNL